MKAFNTVFAQVLADGAELGGNKVTVFYASDSERAKQTARTLAESMGFETIDAGGLKNARYLEPLAATARAWAPASHRPGSARPECQSPSRERT